MKANTWWVLGFLLVGGCASLAPRVKPLVNFVPLSTQELNRKAKNPDKVVVYSEGASIPSVPFEAIGTIAVATSGPVVAGPANVYQGYNGALNTEECFDILRKEAARRGGDAVIHVEYKQWNGSGGNSGPRTVGEYVGNVIVWVNK